MIIDTVRPIHKSVMFFFPHPSQHHYHIFARLHCSWQSLCATNETLHSRFADVVAVSEYSKFNENGSEPKKLVSCSILNLIFGGFHHCLLQTILIARKSNKCWFLQNPSTNVAGISTLCVSERLYVSSFCRIFFLWSAIHLMSMILIR